MASRSSTDESTSTFRVLITGANTGLGLAICKRLADEFLETRPPTQNLHLLITTRSSAKSSSTLSVLRSYLSRDARAKARSSARVQLSAYELDLCDLRQVRAAAARISADFEGESLDALVCNAGISGWTGLDWPRAIWSVLVAPVQSTTWVEYNVGSLKLLCAPQLPGNKGRDDNDDSNGKRGEGEEEREPPLGQVFCANVFGHYLLAHWLSGLLSRRNSGQDSRRGRLIWTGSVDAPAYALQLDDMQALGTRKAYESSKRLTDLLALTADLPQTRAQVDRFWSPKGEEQNGTTKPAIYISHPGVVSTEILPLPYVLRKAKELSFYLARLLGSPWHNVDGYKGAVSAVWLMLAPQATLDGAEDRDGKAKWGSSTDLWGRERVRRTETEGWGYGGVVGAETRFGRSFRRAGTGDLSNEDLAQFIRDGTRAWSQMERLREEWLKILEP